MRALPTREVGSGPRAVRPGGNFGFLTHNQTLEAFTEIIWKWEYLGDHAKGGHDFHKFIAPAELERRLAARGFSVRHLQGIAWTPCPSLVDDLSISYMGYAVRDAG